MHLSYSGLRGRPVRDADGRHLGRILDLVVGPDGEDVVVTGLVVGHGRFALFLNRLHPRWGRPARFPAHLAEAGPDGLRLASRR